MVSKELKSKLNKLLDAYMAKDLAETLSVICEEEAAKSYARQQGHRGALYQRWGRAFRSAETIIDQYGE